MTLTLIRKLLNINRLRSNQFHIDLSFNLENASLNIRPIDVNSGVITLMKSLHQLMDVKYLLLI